MAALEVKTSYATYDDCMLAVGRYQMDGSIAVEIVSKREGSQFDLTAKKEEDESYIDTNNCPWAVDFLQSKDLAKMAGKTRRSGCCVYPAMKFNRDKLAEFEGEC